MPVDNASQGGLNSPAGTVLASALTGLREAVYASSRPAGPRAILEPAWSGLGLPAGRENEGDLMILCVLPYPRRAVGFQVLDYN